MNKLKQTYLPGLDGIRAFAIFSVFAYHLNYQWAKGGFIGVDVFFVLSGYLITSSLLAQWQKKQTIDYKRFLYGRFKRLIPAAYFMIIVVVAFSFIFKQELLPTLRGDAIASLFLFK
ncbi:acyltransferase [Brochothrix thermosphacta DSM 20171 = FSL F6-1036]|nr:acyltransferase [Brochothrix thermosphacta DSM 20171 = FSL F6-1036]